MTNPEDTYTETVTCDRCGRAMPAVDGTPYGESTCNRRGCTAEGKEETDDR